MNNKTTIWIAFYAMMTFLCLLFFSVLLFIYAVVSDYNFTLISISSGLVTSSISGLTFVSTTYFFYISIKEEIEGLSKINQK